MQLYIYEHCPYCIRALMIFGLKNLPFRVKVLSNDDEKTPIKLIGAKMLPILARPDGSNLPESMDIVHWVDNSFGQAVLTGEQNLAISDWIMQHAALTRNLVYPRTPQFGFTEFQTAAARAYYTNKKQASIGDFSQHLANSAALIEQAQAALEQLVPLISTTTACNGSLSSDDIQLFPILLSLTMVKGLTFPAKVLDYLNSMAQQSKIATYFDRAI